MRPVGPVVISRVSLRVGGLRRTLDVPPSGLLDVSVPPTTADAVELTVLGTSGQGINLVGVNEIGIAGATVTRVARMPTRLTELTGQLDSADTARLAHTPLDVVFSRVRGTASSGDDEETGLNRDFTLPQDRTFRLYGLVRPDVGRVRPAGRRAARVRRHGHGRLLVPAVRQPERPSLFRRRRQPVHGLVAGQPRRRPVAHPSWCRAAHRPCRRPPAGGCRPYVRVRDARVPGRAAGRGRGAATGSHPHPGTPAGCARAPARDSRGDRDGLRAAHRGALRRRAHLRAPGDRARGLRAGGRAGRARPVHAPGPAADRCGADSLHRLRSGADADGRAAPAARAPGLDARRARSSRPPR